MQDELQHCFSADDIEKPATVSIKARAEYAVARLVPGGRVLLVPRRSIGAGPCRLFGSILEGVWQC